MQKLSLKSLIIVFCDVESERLPNRRADALLCVLSEPPETFFARIDSAAILQTSTL